MDSVFDLSIQQDNVDFKIIVALERISESFRVLLWEEAKKYGLSPIQIQILIFSNYHKEEHCKVGYLAKEFNLTKATISDSVRVLLKKELIEKSIDPEDSRSYSISLTNEGKTIADDAGRFTNPLLSSLSELDASSKSSLLNNLLSTIHHLIRADVIDIQRMCQTCRFLELRGEKLHCSFLNQELKPKDLRIDCPEHEEKVEA